MVFVADDLGAWLVALLAEADRRKLTTLILGDEQTRALRPAATESVRRTVAELCPGDAKGNAGELRVAVCCQGFAGSAWRAWYGNGGPVGRESAKIDPLPRTSVARSVCHQCCCHDHHEDDHRGGRGVRPWPSGRADPDRAVRAGRFGAGRCRCGPAAATAAAIAGGPVFRAGAGLFPQAGYPGVWGKLTRGAGRAGPGRSLGQGAAGPAPAGRRRAGEGAVRGAGRSGGLAAHARRVLRPVPYRRLRRLQVAQSPRHQAEPGLAGQDERRARGDRLPGHPADDARGDRHPGA